MKTKSLLLICSILLFSLMALGKGNVEIKRVVSKQFKVTGENELSVSNKYGNIVVNTWAKDEIDISVEIIGKADDEKIAQELADRVSIDFNQSGSVVSAQTVFEQTRMRTMNCNNCGTTVHYTINVPKQTALRLVNKYGNIQLEETIRPFNAEVKYGNIYASRLTADNNLINIKYGNIELKESGRLNLEMGYSDARIDKISELTLNSAYSKLNTEDIGTLKLDSKYDKFAIGTIHTFILSSRYSDFNIKRLIDQFKAQELRYCKVAINDVDLKFNLISIEAAYTNIRLNVTDRHNFRANISTRYGNIRMNGLKLTDVSLDGGDRYTKSVVGIVGHESDPQAKIQISDSYADIILSK